MAEQATSPISCPEQVCYERILPQESHFYKPHKTHSDTGKHGEEWLKHAGAEGLELMAGAHNNYVCIRLVIPENF